MDKSQDTYWVDRASDALEKFIKEMDIIDDDVYEQLHILLNVVWRIESNTVRETIIQTIIEKRC